MNTSLLPFAIDLLAKSSCILLLAFAVQALWRGASAAQRCLVWGSAFVLLALLPFAGLVTPRWSLAIAIAEAETAPAMPGIDMAAEQVAASVEPFVAAPGSAAVWQLPEWNLMEMVAALWLLGTALVLAWRGVGQWQAARLHRQSQTVDDARMLAALRRIARELGIRRSIDLRMSETMRVPLTWGVFRPVVLMPAEALRWDDAALDGALRHELSHVRHLDALTRWLSTCVCAVLWPNPLVWLAAKAWHMAQEQACDDVVLRSGAAAQNYALQLLEAARSQRDSRRPCAAALAMAKPSTLETRLTAIMDEARDRQPLRRGAWLAGLATAIVMVWACTAMQIRAQDKPAPSAGAATSPADATGDKIPETKMVKEAIHLKWAKAEDVARKFLGIHQKNNPTEPRVKVIPIKRTNSLLVAASPADLALVKELVASMDREDAAPADRYFAAYLLCRDGEKLEEKSDDESALRKYIEAHRAIASIAKDYPTWQSQMVGFRLKRLEAAILRIDPTARDRVANPRE